MTDSPSETEGETTSTETETSTATTTETPSELKYPDDAFGSNVVLADGEGAKMPVVISEEANQTIRGEAEKIANYLSEMSGADFTVQTGDGEEGIVFGIPKNFEGIPFEVSFGDGVFEQDQYIIGSTENGVYLLGATSTSARFAGWDLLRKFGYRYFFPRNTWEVVPEHDKLEISVDSLETPDWKTRRGPRSMSSATWVHDWYKDDWDDWTIRNRTKSQFQLRTGHSWGEIYKRNREAFHENPEWIAGYTTPEEIDDHLENDPRHPLFNIKFDLTHEELRELIVEDRIAKLKEIGGHSVSIDPSDGGGWCRTERCTEEIGGPSDQMALIANEVAEGISEELGDQYYVGHYAYNYHSAPPSQELRRNVIPSLATNYLKSDYTFDEMLTGWGEKSETIGIRAYYGDSVLFPMVPTFNPASKKEYMAESIKYYYSNGARFMNAQANNHWGGNGLGYWLSSRFLWDVDETDNLSELFDDFLEKCFKSASEPMRKFYELINGDYEHIPIKEDLKSTLTLYSLPDDLAERMYTHLEQAYEQAEGEPEARERILDLILYTRYVELYLELHETKEQEALNELVTFAWRIRKRAMVAELRLNTLDVQRNYIEMHPDLNWPGGEGPDDDGRPPEPLREKENVPYSEEQILTFLEAGVPDNGTETAQPETETG